MNQILFSKIYSKEDHVLIDSNGNKVKNDDRTLAMVERDALISKKRLEKNNETNLKRINKKLKKFKWDIITNTSSSNNIDKVISNYIEEEMIFRLIQYLHMSMSRSENYYHFYFALSQNSYLKLQLSVHLKLKPLSFCW